MSRFLRFLGVFVVAIACVFGGDTTHATGNSPSHTFEVTTTNLGANTTFIFTISAAGNFTVDWGDGAAVETITKSNTNNQEISHTYTNGGVYTIGLDGLATGYNSDDSIAAISFSPFETYHVVAGISGSLGAIFPTIGTDVPSFRGAFSYCYQLTSISGTLFNGVTGARPYMFEGTFYNTNISEIPGNLFSGISGAADYMFYGTFSDCDNLMFLPNGLFSGVSGTAPGLFFETFRDCGSLTGYIPKGLFNFGTGGLTYNASNGMMSGVFSGTNLATSCDSYNMTRYTSDFDSYFGGKVVCQMPDVTVNFSCRMPTNVPGYPIGDWTSPSPIVAPITSGNVTFTFPSGANCDGGDYGTKLNAWTCDSPVCNNRTWSSNGTAVFNEPWDGSTELNFHMVYEPAVFTIPLDKNRYYYDGTSNQVDTTPVAGNVTTLYEKWGVGWSTNPNGPFTTSLTLLAGDLPTANGFEFGGWVVTDNYVGDIFSERVAVDSAGRVIMTPFWWGGAESKMVPLWLETDASIPMTIVLECQSYNGGGIGYCDSGDCAFAQNFNGTTTFTDSGGYYGASVQYGDNIVVPSKNACERQGYYYNQWFVAPWGDRITVGNNNTNYTWNHKGWDYDDPYTNIFIDTYMVPDWQPIETTITLSPQNGNAGGGTTALYTIAQNQDNDSKSGVYLDSGRTEPVTLTSNNTIMAPTAPTATLTFNLNDSVAAPATFTCTPRSYYDYDGNNVVSQTCSQKYGITIGNDEKSFTTPYQFNGYYSAASGGTQYIEKRGNFYYITQAGIDAGLAYTSNATWYGQWDTLDPYFWCCMNRPIPLRPGYEFSGWWTAASGGTQVTNFAVSQNTTVYAHWEEQTIVFGLDANHEDAVDGNVTTVYEKYGVGWSTNYNGPFGALTLTGSQLPTRAGYMLTGFYDAASGGNPVGTFSNGTWTLSASSATVVGDGNKALYAHWALQTYNATFTCKPTDNIYNALRYMGISDDADMYEQLAPVATMTLTNGQQFTAPSRASCALKPAATATEWFGNPSGSSGWTRNGINSYAPGQDYLYQSAWGDATFNAVYVSKSFEAKYYCNGNGQGEPVARDSVNPYLGGENDTPGYKRVVVRGVGTGDNQVNCSQPANSVGFVGWLADADNTALDGKIFSAGALSGQYNDVTQFPPQHVNFVAVWDCDTTNTGYEYDTGSGQCVPVIAAITLDKNANDAVDGVTTVYEQYGVGWATTNNAQTTFGNITLTGNQLPTRAGYTLTGFYDAASGGNPVGTFSGDTWTPPSSTTYTAGATLYAHWTLSTYNINYVPNGGSRFMLPGDYTQLEYIESDGSQIIDTGVMGVNTRMVIDAQWTGSSVSTIRLLAGYASNYAGTYVGVSSNRWALYTTNAYRIPGATSKTRLSVVFDRDPDSSNFNRAILTANETTVTYVRSSNSRANATLKLFAGDSTVASTPNGFIGRVYQAMIFDNETNHLLFNGVPARRNNDNALGIYDTVRGIFIENSGGGTFTAGNAVITTMSDAYPSTYTYGTGAIVYGVVTRPNSVFEGWCRDANLTTGCATPHEIGTTETGDVTLYAKWRCDGGYTWNAQSQSCELDLSPAFTITTTTAIANGTQFKFSISASGWFVVDCGADGILSGPSGHVFGNNIYRFDTAEAEYVCEYSSGGSKTIQFFGHATSYSGTSTVATISFFNATVNDNDAIVANGDGTEVYIAAVSGSLGALFPTKPGETNFQPRFYQTFRNAVNMSQTMASLSGVFNGVYGAPVSRMFASTFRGCSSLTGAIPENLFMGISGAPATNMFYGTFYGCSGLTGSIPATLFGREINGVYRGIDGAPATSMFAYTFYGCSNLSGQIPATLFGREINGVYYGVKGLPATSMFFSTFYNCSSLTGIGGALFAGISGGPASASMFSRTFRGCSSLTGSIPSGLFGNLSGDRANSMFFETFYGCSLLTGNIPPNLFGSMTGEPKQNMFRSTFYNCSSLTGEIPSNLFGAISGDGKSGMFYNTFSGCSGLTGTIPGNLFGGQNLTGPGQTEMFYRTFYNCSGLSGYVPENLFGRMTVPATVPDNMMTQVFANSGLATSCPCGTTEITTSPFRTYWQSTSSSSNPKKVSCTVGLDTGQHWYGGTCATMCPNPLIDELHVGSLPAFPVLADKIISPSINIKYNGTTCYVPLAEGNGGQNSLNMKYNGIVYHADRPDDITPTGFGQRD